MNRVFLLGLALFPMAAFASSHREGPVIKGIVQVAEASSHREGPVIKGIVQVAEASSAPTSLTPPQVAPVRVHRDGYTVVSALDAE